MKRYTQYIATLLIALLGVACQSDINDNLGVITPNEGGIVLSVEGGTLGADSRAEDMEDNDKENGGCAPATGLGKCVNCR